MNGRDEVVLLSYHREKSVLASESVSVITKINHNNEYFEQKICCVVEFARAQKKAEINQNIPEDEPKNLICY
jgi:hypothetical protein